MDINTVLNLINLIKLLCNYCQDILPNFYAKFNCFIFISGTFLEPSTVLIVLLLFVELMYIDRNVGRYTISSFYIIYELLFLLRDKAHTSIKYSTKFTSIYYFLCIKLRM